MPCHVTLPYLSHPPKWWIHANGYGGADTNSSESLFSDKLAVDPERSVVVESGEWHN